MPMLSVVLAFFLLPLGSWAPADTASAPPQAKQAFPKKAGIYAMTPQGPVELTVSGERSEEKQAIGLKTYYSSDSFDRIPTADSVRSFFVSLMDWTPKSLYLVVGRDALTNSLDKYQRFAGRTVPRGVVAIEVLSSDFESPEFILRAIRKLAPAGVADADLEVYLVLELKSAAGLNDRAYPIRIAVPKG